jgi:hypothetical protein
MFAPGSMLVLLLIPLFIAGSMSNPDDPTPVDDTPIADDTHPPGEESKFMNSETTSIISPVVRLTLLLGRRWR